jgi:hypothetical protein
MYHQSLCISIPGARPCQARPPWVFGRRSYWADRARSSSGRSPPNCTQSPVDRATVQLFQPTIIHKYAQKSQQKPTTSYQEASRNIRIHTKSSPTSSVELDRVWFAALPNRSNHISSIQVVLQTNHELNRKYSLIHTAQSSKKYHANQITCREGYLTEGRKQRSLKLHTEYYTERPTRSLWISKSITESKRPFGSGELEYLSHLRHHNVQQSRRSSRYRGHPFFRANTYSCHHAHAQRFIIKKVTGDPAWGFKQRVLLTRPGLF